MTTSGSCLVGIDWIAASLFDCAPLCHRPSALHETETLNLGIVPSDSADLYAVLLSVDRKMDSAQSLIVIRTRD